MILVAAVGERRLVHYCYNNYLLFHSNNRQSELLPQLKLVRYRCSSSSSSSTSTTARYQRGGKLQIHRLQQFTAPTRQRPVSFSSSSSRGSSSGSKSGEPRFKIPAHVATFTLLLIPCIGFAFYADRFGPDSEQLEERIRERYGQDVAVAHQKNQAMREFYQKAIKDAESGTEDDRLSQVLHGGKGEKKRLHAIDKELYGTQAGVETKLQMQKQLETAAAEKKERRKQRQKKKAMIEMSSKDDPNESLRDVPDQAQPPPRDATAVATSEKGFQTTQLVTLVAVGTLAALTGFLVGGGRRN